MYWRSSGGGVFQTAANWSEFAGHTTPATDDPDDPIELNLPAADHRAVFDLLFNGTITFNSSVITADAQVVYGSAFFALGGHTWNAGSTFSILNPSINADSYGPEDPPYTGVTVNTTVSNGTLNTTSLLVGAGHNLNNGTLTLTNTALNSQNLTIAQSGTGTLNLTNGSILNTTPVLSSAMGIGGQAGSHGTVNVSGGSIWNIGSNGILQVGGFGGTGTGTLNITSGTVSGNEMHVAINSGITGAVYVNGSTSLLTMSNGIDIGQGGTGTMSITNGGDVFSLNGNSSSVGNMGGGTGNVSISGAGSTWTTGGLELSGSGSNIVVSTSGLLDTRGLFTVQNNANLDIQATGNLEAATLQVWQGGTANLSGTVRASVITVSGAGSVVYQTNDNVTIDNGEGVGVLNITNGGVYHGAPRIGLGTGAATGTANISGFGSLWDIGMNYTIGAGGGLGTANLTQGGRVTSGDLFIGRDSNGVVEIQNNGSQWSGGAAYIGGSSTAAAGAGITGRLTVQNGGSAGFTGQVKVWSGGTVQVLSGSSLSAAGIHVAGGVFQAVGTVSNAGTLIVSNGGSYSTAHLGLNNNISVSGIGSIIDADSVTVQNGHTFTIGSGGSLDTNSITLNGGTLDNGGSILGNGSLSVTGGGLYASTGVLELSDASLISASVVGLNSEINANGINVRTGGVLNVGSGGTVTGAVQIFGGLTTGSLGGIAEFHNFAAAGSNTYTTSGGGAGNASGGSLRFNQSSTASNGTFITQGGSAIGALGSIVQFNHNATAASGTFTAGSSLASGAGGGVVRFNNSATAANGIFTTNGGSADGFEGGHMEFYGNATAANGSFTIHGGSVSGALGSSVQFYESAMAGSGIFTINAGGTPGASNGMIEFSGSASAGNAAITLRGSAFTGSIIDGQAGGMAIFSNYSHAGNATLIAEGGTDGGLGAAIIFSNFSDGDEAAVEVHGNGRLDISLHEGSEVQVGSIEGTGNVFLGSNTLNFGLNGMDTTFSGVIQDDGVVFDDTGVHEFGGSIIKVGSGITTLTGMNTYTGMTGAGGGTLVADLSLNSSVLNSQSELHVGGGTFELKGLAATARAQALNGLTIHSGYSSVTVNNVGTSTTLDLSSGGIVRAETGIVDFRATAGTFGTDAIIKTGQANDSTGIIGAWATVNGGSALAANNGSNVIVAYTAYDEISTTIVNNLNSNTRISSGAGVVTLGSEITAINTLTQNHASASTVDTAGKTLSTRGILVAPTAAALTIGSSAGSGTLTAGSELILINNSGNTLTINSNVAGSIDITTSGSATLNGANTYTGATNVTSGMLVVDGSIASSSGVNLSFGSTLSGHGSVGNIYGNGTVAPGNSPGIMTSTWVNANDGLNFLFQFTQTGIPNFLNGSGSGNDLLRLAGSTPFTSALTGDSTVTLDFSSLALNLGDIFLGGFYADLGGDFFSQIQNANFVFLGLDVGQKITVGTMQQNADFGSGEVNGYISKFTLTGLNATLTPASISNNGVAVLNVSGLDVGESVVIERFLDQNDDGSIGLGEPLVEVFTITDGLVTSIAGVRNTHVPGDEDLTADGEIDFHVSAAIGSELGRIAGAHIIRVSSPTNNFTSFTRELTIIDSAQSQSIHGTVTANGSPVPNATVILLDPAADNEFVRGVCANDLGQFSVTAPIGTYLLLAVKPGLVADFNTAPSVILTAGATEERNLLLIAGTTTITGAAKDSTTATGLGGVQFFLESQSGHVTIISTKMDGTFDVPVTPDVWYFENSGDSIERLGYLNQNADVMADASSASVSDFNIGFTKVTALIYGTVTNDSAQPVAGIPVDGDANNGLYFSNAITDAAGKYVLGATIGTWDAHISENGPETSGYILPEYQQITLASAQAVQSDFELVVVTAHIIGAVTNNGNPVPNILVGAYNAVTYQYVSKLTAADGSFDLGVVAGTWKVLVESNSAATFNIVSPVLERALITNQTINGVDLAIQDSTALISGFVRDNSSAPVGALVHATATVSGVLYSASQHTDGSGNYSFPVIDAVWTINTRNTGDFTQPLPLQATISGSNVVRDFTLTKSPVITLDPSDQTVSVGQSLVFSIGANSNNMPTFQWQISTDNGISWNPLSNDASHANVTTKDLNITASLGMNGYRYRCSATNAFGSVISDIAALTVNPLTAAGSWRQLYFGTSENTGNAADGAIPDGDGITNMTKYALVIVPGSSAAAELPPAQIIGGRLSLVFTRDPARNDVTVTVQACSAFDNTWTAIATSVNGAAFTGSGAILEANASGGCKTVEVRDILTTAQATKRFLRIEVKR